MPIYSTTIQGDAASTPAPVTVANATIAVTQSTSPWVVSGTVTANIGTTNGLALDASVTGLQVSQGSTTSGQKGGLILGAVTTAAPAYTTAQTSPLSLDTAGNLRVTIASSSAEQNVNLNQVGGAAIALGQTTMSASLPVAFASNQSTLPVSLTSTTITGTVAVTQSTSPWVVSGTVTANAGTNLNTSALALDTSVNGIIVAQGSTTSGEKGTLIQGAVTTAAPTYTTAQTSPLSLTTAGALRIDGSATTQPVSGTVTANAGTGNFTVVQATAANLNATVTGTVAATQSGTWNITNISGTISLPTGASTSALQTTGNTSLSTIAGAVIAQGSTTSGQSGELIMGAVTTSAPTYVTAQTSPLSLDTSGRVRTQPSPFTDITASGTINALNGAVTATTNGTGSLVFQLTGTFSATFVAEGSVDNTNWTNLTIFPASGISTTGGVTAVSSYRVPSTGGYAQMRVRCSAYTSGTATVQMNLSEPVGAPQIFSPNAQNCLVGASHVDGFKATYSSSITALAMAATPTDVFTITGSATKTVRVTRIYMTGTQTTGNTSSVLLIRRSAANTGGTSTTPTVVQNDTNDAAGTAVVRAYTVNPTGLGATVGTMATYAMYIPAPQPANANSPFIAPDLFAAIRPAEAIVLRGTAQVLAVNFNSTTVTGNSMNIFIEWTEE